MSRSSATRCARAYLRSSRGWRGVARPCQTSSEGSRDRRLEHHAPILSEWTEQGQPACAAVLTSEVPRWTLHPTRRAAMRANKLLLAGLIVTLVGLFVVLRHELHIPSYWTPLLVGVALLIVGVIQSVLSGKASPR